MRTVTPNHFATTGLLNARRSVPRASSDEQMPKSALGGGGEKGLGQHESFTCMKICSSVHAICSAAHLSTWLGLG